MKVLTIKEPWATLIVNGYKKYEFRSWKTNYRGEFYIHASKSIDKEAMKHFENLKLDYQPGKIIGKVNLVDCIEVTRDFENELIKENPSIYSLTIGRKGYAFKLENVKKLERSIPAKGKLNFWEYK